MKLCFYCVMQHFGGREIQHRSIDNQKVIVIRSNDLYAAVSYTTFVNFTVTPGNIATHERIIRSIQEKTPVIPFPLNTIVGETIGKGILYSYYPELTNLLRKIGNKEEYIVRVLRDSKEKLSPIHGLPARRKGLTDNGRKKSETSYNKHLDVTGHKLAAHIHSQFEQIAAASNYTILETKERLIEAEYLVSHKKIELFRQTFNWVVSLYPELHFSLDGPQPAYHFNTVDITPANTRLRGKHHR